MRLLLLSTGGRPSRFFRHARAELKEFLAGRHRIGFVTAANLNDEIAYFARAKAFFRTIGIVAEHIRWQTPPKSLDHLDAIVVGGGNTYALLDRLRRSGLLREIRRVVRAGTPYIGASAGTNIAGPNILTTNDWNVVGNRRFDALGFVPWNINVHYPAAPRAEHGRAKFSETRDQRIAEFHNAKHPVTGLPLHRNPVVGIEEAACILVEGSQATVRGTGRVRWFVAGMKPQWVRPDQQLPLWGARTK
ncbi:MAG: dipeptidase PepE [bacterium]|nr:dipeptidase PepE [bacterium]